MKYLFFDLEFAATLADGKKICEFGYILTNEKFETIESLNLLINPNIAINDWDSYVVDKILTRSYLSYLTKPTFDSFYELIKQLFKKSNYIFGYSIINDVTAINDELKRYELDPLEYEFYDVQQLYSKSINKDQQISLANAIKQFNIENETREHDAEADAVNTMKVLKEIVENENISLEELLLNNPEAKDKCHDYTTDKLDYNLLHPTLIKENNFIKDNKFNKRRYSQLVDNVIPLKQGTDKLKNKKVYISVQYTNYNYVQTLNLIQLITNEGGSFVKKYNDANLFVRCPGEHSSNDDNKISEYRKIVGPHLKIIEFNELLELLNVVVDDLNDMPEESFYFLKEDKKEEEKVESLSLFEIARDYRK